MKIKIILIIIILGNLIVAQSYKYYKMQGWDLVETPNKNEALRWDSYLFGLKTHEDFNWVPSYLGFFIDSRFNEAIGIWKEAMNQTTFSLYVFQNQSDGIEVFFTDETKYFTVPNEQAGMTTSCVANDKFVISCMENEAQRKDPILPGNPKVTRARIVFNGTSSFPTTILSGLDCSSVPQDKVSFTKLAMHELGHIFGMGHDPLNPSSIMWKQVFITRA